MAGSGYGDDGEKKVEEKHSSSALEKLKSAGIIAGATGVVGLFGYNAYQISMWMSGLSLAHGMYFGVYAGGAISALAGVGGFFFVRRFVSIHPESLFSNILQRMSTDPVIQAELGGNIKAGKFKAYAYSGGFVYKDRQTRKSISDAVSFEKYGLQLMFQMNGDNGSGMVSVRAAQSFLGSYWIRNLAIDFADGDRIVLEGTPDEVAYKGIVRLR